MKKLFSLFVCVLLIACVFMAPSCKKIYHETLPTPTNIRLMGFTKITTRNIIAPPTAYPVVTETYSFTYDNSNRLSMVLYATNDSSQKSAGLLNERMTYTYTGSNVYRTVTNFESSSVVEQDTFYLNGYNQLLSSSFPFEAHSYTYQGQLVASQTDVYRDSGTSISATSYFTSDNHDLLHQLFNGTLVAYFPDSGIRPDISPAFPGRDSILSYPLSVTWTATVVTLKGIDSTYVFQSTNSNDGAVLNGYSENLEEVSAVDANGIYVRPVYFPAGLNSSKFFQIYDYLYNRIGDYLQLEAFKTYGVNIYQNEHLIKQMSTPFDTTFVSYDIDAQSKVTDTHVLLKDKLGNSTTIEYKLVYNTD